MNKKNESLNNLFTAEEFNFINRIDSDLKNFDYILQKENSYKNSITKLISSLNNLSINSDTASDKHEEVALLLSTSSALFELLNKNIDMINSIKSFSNNINNKIVDLLIKIDSDGENATEEKFCNEISNIKNELINSDYYFNNYKEDILHNHEKVDDFLHSEDVQKYLSFFFINLEEINRLNSVFETTIEKEDFSEPIDESNNTLLFLEKENKVYLPYSKKEVTAYLDQYPNQYKSFRDVIEKEFVFSASFYMKYPVVARFREAYSLIRDRESKSIIEAFKYAIDLMLRRDLNPAIIAACKSQEQLEDYLDCLSRGHLEEFTAFNIKFEVTPLNV